MLATDGCIELNEYSTFKWDIGRIVSSRVQILFSRPCRYLRHMVNGWGRSRDCRSLDLLAARWMKLLKKVYIAYLYVWREDQLLVAAWIDNFIVSVCVCVLWKTKQGVEQCSRNTSGGSYTKGMLTVTSVCVCVCISAHGFTPPICNSIFALLIDLKTCTTCQWSNCNPSKSSRAFWHTFWLCKRINSSYVF